MDQRRCVNYFIVDGKKYYTGTVFKTKHYGDAAFVCTYYPKHMKGVYIVYRIISTGQERWTPVDMFKEDVFVCITGAVDSETKMPKTKYMKDSDINGLSIGWLWYITLMLFGVIIKGCVIWWIFISIVFFSWRYKKVHEEGTYIDWNGK